MCGDTYCHSCGPAQGNSYCENCGKWSADGGCDDAVWCEEENQKREEQLYQEWLELRDFEISQGARGEWIEVK